VAGCNIETDKTEIWEYTESAGNGNWEKIPDLDIDPLGFSFLYTHSDNTIILGGGLSPRYDNPSKALIFIKDNFLMGMDAELEIEDYFFDNQVL
jgi:hypothetical protein